MAWTFVSFITALALGKMLANLPRTGQVVVGGGETLKILKRILALTLLAFVADSASLPILGVHT